MFLFYTIFHWYCNLQLLWGVSTADKTAVEREKEILRTGEFDYYNDDFKHRGCFAAE